MSAKYWDENKETMPAQTKRHLQTQKLQGQLRWVYERIPFYKEAFDNLKIRPSDFHRLEDIAKFPFTLKTDIAANYPFRLSAVPKSEIARIHASSGTTGKPAMGLYTQEDLDQWTECMARALWAQEIRSDTTFQNAFGMGLFTGGMGFLQGAVRIGCTLVPTGTGMTERQIMLMQDFGTNAFSCTASYCFTVLETAERMGVDLTKLDLKTGHFGAEPWTDEMRREMEQRMGIRAYDHYGLTELMGPGVAFNCENYALHINDDHVYPEVVDPSTLKPVPPGEEGELVLTALQREAMPLIRYRTRDITRLLPDKCDCGRTLITMAKVLGRTDDMMIISGVNVFPSQIESVLMQFQAIEAIYQIRLVRKGYKDQISVETEVKADFYQQGPEKIAALAADISSKIRQIIGIKIPVTILPAQTIPRSQGKAQRLMDERDIKKA